MKKIVKMLSLMLCAILLFGPVKTEAAVFVNKTETTMRVGEKRNLKASGIKASKMKWKSSNKAVATVSKKGQVKALKTGSSTITAIYKKVKFSCKVYVLNKNVVLHNGKKVKIMLNSVNAKEIAFTVTNKTKQSIQINLNYINLNNTTFEAGNYGTSLIAVGDTRVIVVPLNIGNSSIKTISGLFELWDEEGFSIGTASIKKTKL